MALKCGIVGLPNVGKSTLFNAISNNKAVAANFPFCTIEPNIGLIAVPDNRLDVLKDLVDPQKVIPTTIEFVDIAGLVKGASKGEGLGNKFLSNIKEVDAIVHVVRCFNDDNIVHIDGKVDPIADKGIIDIELQLKDLESIEKKINKIKKQAKSGDVKLKKELDVLDCYKNHLESGKNARLIEVSDEDRLVVSDLKLLTSKPIIYVANVDEQALPLGNDYSNKLKKYLDEEENADIIVVSAAIESQIAEIENVEDRLEFLSEYKLSESGLNKLIKIAYQKLDLITYFTAGKTEVKAWTIKKGWKAPKAAGVIHSDFERGFIKAEVIKLEDYQNYKTELKCKAAGKIMIEGKEYVVQDGDIIHFRFNV